MSKNTKIIAGLVLATALALAAGLLPIDSLAADGQAAQPQKAAVGDKDTDNVKKEMSLLEGEWSMVSGEIGGQAMPEEMAKTAKRTAKGNETTVMIGGQLLMKATFTVDPSKKPKTIDYNMTDGFSKGKQQFGIYELDGDTVKFCFGSPDKARPTDFTTKAEDGRTLSVWKKSKEKGK